MTIGDQFAIAVLAQTQCDSSIEANVITRQEILMQIAQEFEWEGLANTVERLDNLKASGRPRGMAFLICKNQGWVPEFEEQERQR